MSNREVMQQALEALEAITRSVQSDHQAEIAEDAITALREALAQEHAMHELARLGQEIEQAEPTCPDCKAAVLFECVACSSNNYPPQQQAEPPPEWLLIKNILDEYGLDAIAFVAEFKAAQRPWVGLTEQDMPSGEDPMFDHKYFIAGMVYADKVLMEKNT